MRVSEGEFALDLFQCFHEERLVVHLSKGMEVLCGRLSISVEGELLDKIFMTSSADSIDAEDSSYSFCRLCYGRCYDHSKPKLSVGGSGDAMLAEADSASTGPSSSSSESVSGSD